MSRMLFPPLTPELVRFAEGDVSMLVATRSADLRPNTTRAVGLKVWPGASQMTLYLSAATSGACVADLRDNGQIAVTLSVPATHQTIQVKGVVREVRDGGPEDRMLTEAYRERLSRALAAAGVPVRVTRRLNCWPAFAVDLDIQEVFTQTPGPGAGARMSTS